MKIKTLIPSLLLPLLLVSSMVSAADMTATMPNGVTITTTVDTVRRQVTYAWDFTNLAGDYEQVDVGQPLFPASSLCSGCVVSAGLTEYSIFDAGGGNVESVLQLKYQGGNPPARVNSVVLTYSAAYLFSGTFIDGSPAAPGADGNIVVTYRNPPGGEDATLWAYTPELQLVNQGNNPPVAAAGADQSVLVGDTVTLDGSASHDVDGDGLTYAWLLVSNPAGSTATLSDTTAIKPTFVVDLPGTYIAQLVVNDGMVDSAPDSVSITTGNSAPVADAGADQSVQVGDTVMLDGSGSHDVDGDGLTYAWSLASIPAGSIATLSNAATVNPAFVVDLPGTYVAQLIVNDGMLDSAPDTMIVTMTNMAPTANPGGAYAGMMGEAILFDGSGSFDPDGRIIAYGWDFGDGSTGTGVNPSHTYAAAGTPTVTLTVTDDGGLKHTAATTATIQQPAMSDFDIKSFRATRRVRLSRKRQPLVISIKLVVKNNSRVPGATTVSIQGVHEDGSVLATYTVGVNDPVGRKRSRIVLAYEVDAGVNPGSILWTVSFDDGDPDIDEASTQSLVLP